MAIIFKKEQDYVNTFGREEFEKIYQYFMNDLTKGLSEKPEMRDMKFGIIVGLLKLVYPIAGTKWLYYEFCYEIMGQNTQQAAIESWLGESILYDDGENIDEYLDAHNKYKELSKQEGYKCTTIGMADKR